MGYHPGIGMFVERDPVETGQNLYEYVDGDPVDFVDPAGLAVQTATTSQPLGPSKVPTSQPGGVPTSMPTSQPTSMPSSQPTSLPTTQPTSRPAVPPTGQPSNLSKAEEEAISKLFSQLQPLARQLLTESRKELGVCKIRLGETLRTPERQNQIPGQNTSVRGLDSMHCWGLAFDISIYDKDGKYMRLQGSNARQEQVYYEKVAKIGRKLGLIWGGDWVEPYDPSHFQYNIDRNLGIAGPSAAKIKVLYRSGPAYAKMTTVQFIEWLYKQKTAPTSQPTNMPTSQPASMPTSQPTSMPTSMP